MQAGLIRAPHLERAGRNLSRKRDSQTLKFAEDACGGMATEIDRILRETIPDPVGSEFMAPPVA